MSSIKVCNFNCICHKEDCTFKHFISFEKRSALIKVFPEIENLNEHRREEFSMIRKVNCTFGQLCNNSACNFKHGYNFTGRELIIAKFNEITEKKEKKDDKTPKVCFKNCLCDKEDCTYHHYLNFNKRSELNSILEENSDISEMIEEENEKRKRMCIYGQLCNREGCTFKHGINIEGRKKLILKFKEWKEVKK